VTRIDPGPDGDLEGFRRYRASGSVDERNALVVEQTPLADAVASRFSGRGESDEDLRQVARLALVRAVERFDPERGVPFRSFAVPTLVGELKRHFRDRTWSVSVSRRLRDLGPAIGSARQSLMEQGIAAPTVADVAAHLGIDPELVVEADTAGRSRFTASLDAPGADDRHLVAELLGTLSERDRRIVVLAFYRDWTQERIAADVGLSQEQVSRVLSRTVRRLRPPGN
jgi:RNA polymerase sigma-B factor